VQNYFSSLEAGEAQAEEAPGLEEAVPEGGANEELETGADSAGQSGDNTALSNVAEEAPESVAELEETGQDYEAEVVEGVEDAPPADEAEVTTHGEDSGEDEVPPEKQ
jgi:N utilization substance protein A